MTKRDIIAAIQRAGRELGRAPSRGELKSRTGVSHYRVLTQFRSLRQAVRAAGLTPSAKGERVSTEELMRDWERVRKKLGRRPSRAEYVREGKYSAGTFVGRFGSWGNIGGVHHGGDHPHEPKPGSSGTPGAETRRKAGEKIARNAKMAKESKLKTAGHKGGEFASRQKTRMQNNGLITRRQGDSSLESTGIVRPTAVPSELAGHRRVTELVAAMVVNTLVPSGDLVTYTPPSQERAWWGPRVIGRSGDLNAKSCSGPSRAVTAPFFQDDRRRAGFAARGLYKDRPVMGPPFARHPLTNAPVNEMGVVFLFGAVAWDMGFQVESLWTRGYPDGRAKREVAPGKWQDVAIEFEYESKNFLRHGHDPKKCDVIVCWVHNWKECPEGIEVIELSRIFG
jgi:Homing endonuclease associated repeat